jgi:hypothetical protein
VELVWPAAHYLLGSVHALQQGWSPDTRRPEAAGEHLARIAKNSDQFLAEQIDRDAKGPRVVLPDRASTARILSMDVGR